MTKKPKTVEALASSLEAAHQEEAQALQKLGVCAMDGLDTTEAEGVLHRVQGRIRVLEAALTVARQKADAMQTSRKQADQQTAIEAEVAAVAHIKSVSVKVDQ